MESLAKEPGFEEYASHAPGLRAKKPLYRLPKGFPHNVASSKSLEHRILRFYRRNAAAKAKARKAAPAAKGVAA